MNPVLLSVPAMRSSPALPDGLVRVMHDVGIPRVTMELIAKCPDTTSGLIAAHDAGRTAAFWHTVDWSRLC